MVVSLGGITLNIPQDKPILKPVVKRNKIAGTGRTKNHIIGVNNRIWKLDVWVNNQTDYDALEALVGTSGLIFIDKYSVSWTVSVTSLSSTRKQFNYTKLQITIEEDE